MMEAEEVKKTFSKQNLSPPFLTRPTSILMTGNLKLHSILSSKRLLMLLVIYFHMCNAQVSYKGLYVVDHKRIGEPDCQQNLVRAWAEALHGPLASYAGKVLDINTPHKVYGKTALTWGARDSGHELGQIRRKVATRMEKGVTAKGRLEIQPVICLDTDCTQATLLLLHDRSERNSSIGHQAWLVAGNGNGAIYQSTMPANIAWRDASFYQSDNSSYIHQLGNTEVRYMSSPTWRPCAANGIAVPISWSSQTSEDTDTLCVTDALNRSAIIGRALTLGPSVLTSSSEKVRFAVASNPVLCNTSLYVGYGDNSTGEETNVFSAMPSGSRPPFVSCSYNGLEYRVFLANALGNLEVLEKCNQANQKNGTLQGGCPMARSCSVTYRQMASLSNSIVNQGARQLRGVYAGLQDSDAEPGSIPGVDLCYGSWPYIDPGPDFKRISGSCQDEKNDDCDENLKFELYDDVLEFTSNILYDQAVNLALAQKRLDLAQSITLFGALAVIFLAGNSAIGAVPGARVFIVNITGCVPRKWRHVIVSIVVVATGVASSFSVWQLLRDVLPYQKSSFYYIPVSTKHVASFNLQALYFVGFAIIEVYGDQSVMGVVIAGGLAITVLVVGVALYGFWDHHRKLGKISKIVPQGVQNQNNLFGPAEALTEADDFLIRNAKTQIQINSEIAGAIGNTAEEVAVIQQVLIGLHEQIETVQTLLQTVQLRQVHRTEG